MSSIVLGCQGGGGEGIIRFPTKKECALDNRGLKWPMFVYELSFSKNKHS